VGTRDRVGRKRETARLLVERGVALRGFTDGRRVDDGEHLFDVRAHERAEEDLLAILKRAKEAMLLDRRGDRFVGRVGARDLRFERLNGGRQEAVQTERRALFIGEGGALVQKRRAQDVARVIHRG
jgi:hypothetical protein